MDGRLEGCPSVRIRLTPYCRSVGDSSVGERAVRTVLLVSASGRSLVMVQNSRYCRRIDPSVINFGRRAVPSVGNSAVWPLLSEDRPVGRSMLHPPVKVPFDQLVLSVGVVFCRPSVKMLCCRYCRSVDR